MISIVVPVYNTERCLEKCLSSIVRQSYRNIEIIIINDGSTDNSGEIIRKFAQNDDRIIIIEIQNGGVSNARNLGLNIAKGDYIWFVDSDDFLYEDSAQMLREKIGQADMAVCSFNVVIDGKADRIFLDLPKVKEIHMSDEFINDLISERVHLGGAVWNKLYRAEVLKNSGLRFEERSEIYAEDALFNMKSLKFMKDIVVVDFPLYGYYQRYESVSHNYKENLELRLKNYLNNLNDFYDKKFEKALKKRGLVFFIEILYNNCIVDYKKFENAARDEFFQNLLDNMDTSGISLLRKTVWIFRKNPKILYILFKISGRDS